MSTATRQRVPVRRSREAALLARCRAGELMRELRLLGFTAAVHASNDLRQHPCVQVGSGLGRHAAGTEYVYVAPDDPADEEGPWWFWWSSLRPVGPVDDVAGAVREIGRGLACAGCPVCVQDSREGA